MYDTCIVQVASQEVQDWYLLPINREINIKFKKEGFKMIDIGRIHADIAALKTLNAEEYCREQVAQVYADFEANREAKILELEKSLEIFEKYQIIEEEPEQTNEYGEA